MKMNLNWKGLVEIVGILSVVGSLAFVALEIRQNTNAARSSTLQTVSEMSFDSTLAMVDNADLRDAWIAARSVRLTDLTEDQQLQLQWFVGALLRVQQNRFNQVKLGVIELDDALDMGGRAASYKSPVFAEIWATARDNYPEDFQAYIDEYVLPLSVRRAR